MTPSKILLTHIFALWCLVGNTDLGRTQTIQRSGGPGDQINVTADKLSISESGTQIEATGRGD
jgi:hypothetical protein